MIIQGTAVRALKTGSDRDFVNDHQQAFSKAAPHLL